MKPEIKAGQRWKNRNSGKEVIVDAIEGEGSLTMVHFHNAATMRRSPPLHAHAFPTYYERVVMKDAPPEATSEHTTAPCRDCGVSGGRHYAACEFYASTPPAAPSPLEVVRNVLTWHRDNVYDNAGPTAFSESLAALATLEESIRADERERIAGRFDRECTLDGDNIAGIIRHGL